MKLLHLLVPSLIAPSALASPWAFRRADNIPTSSAASSFPPAPTPPPQVPGEYCPSFGYGVHCSSDAECDTQKKCVSGPYFNSTDVANCAGTCYSPTESTLPSCPLVNGAQTCRGVDANCGPYRVCIRSGKIDPDRDACNGVCGEAFLGGCPRPNGNGGIICGKDADCGEGNRCQFATHVGDGCSGYCTKNTFASAISTASSTISTSTASSSASASKSSSAPSASAVPGNYCGTKGFDQICTVTAECGTGYECKPRAENGTSTEGCSGVCRSTGLAIGLPTCGYENGTGPQLCRSDGDCGMYLTCIKSGPIASDPSTCNGKCGQGDFGPCPNDNPDGTRNCNQDSQCGFTQRCGPSTRGVPCGGTCTELPRCKTDSDCNPDEFTSYGVCAPNGVCYSFSDCRNDRSSCPGGICGNNSPNATSYQDGFANRTIPFTCIFNTSRSSALVSGTSHPISSDSVPAPTSKGDQATTASSDHHSAPTSRGTHPINPASSVNQPLPTSGPRSDSHAAATSAAATHTHEPAPTPQSQSSPTGQPTASHNGGQPVSSGTGQLPSPSSSVLPKPIVPVMCMGLADIAQMLKEIKDDIAQIKSDISAIKADQVKE